LKYLFIIALLYVSYRMVVPRRQLPNNANEEIQEPDGQEYTDYEEIE